MGRQEGMKGEGRGNREGRGRKGREGREGKGEGLTVMKNSYFRPWRESVKYFIQKGSKVLSVIGSKAFYVMVCWSS